MDGDPRRAARLRSFLLGGIVGASAAIATARRHRPRQQPRESPSGLAAFEQAPCYLETVERERDEAASAPGARARSESSRS